MAYNTNVNVTPDQMEGNQLNTLLSSENPYIQGARASGMQAAASRGGLNGSISAGLAQNAAIAAAAPIAAQQAGVYANAASQDAQSQTQQELANQQALSASNVAGIGAQASMHNAGLTYDTNQDTLAQQGNEFNANWQQAQVANDWNVQNQNRQQQFGIQNAVTGATLGTLMSDPSYWADPSGATGMANFYATNFNDIFGGGTPGTYSTGNDPNQGSIAGGTINVPPAGHA